MEQNSEKIIWWALSKNPNAIHILEQALEHAHYGGNQDKIHWRILSSNPSIFEYDYQAMKDHLWNSGIVEELMANRFHPSNMHKFGDWGFEDMLSPEIVKD